ncbi:MAG: DUF1302 family protein [Oxalobacteraceae bacterium]
MGFCMRTLRCWLALIFILLPIAVSAQAGTEPLLAPPEQPSGGEGGAALSVLDKAGLTGSLRGAYWSSNRLLDDREHVGTASTWLKLDNRLGGGFGVFAEGYASREDLRSEGSSPSRLREAYFDARFGQLDLRLGKQIIAWGRADRLNPTDNLTPRDATLLAADIDEDRMGSVAAKAAWNINASTSLIGVWLPSFQPNRVARRNGIREQVPDDQRNWAVKLDRSGNAFDWSVSYYEGRDLSGDLGQDYVLRYYRTRVIGGDAATTIGSWRIALESAFTRTEDPQGTLAYLKNPFTYTVLGVEKNFGDNTSAIIQIFNRTVLNYQRPDDNERLHAVLTSQLDRRQNGVSVRVAKKWMNETLETEFSGLRLIERSGYSLRPRMVYLWSDRIKLLTGYEYFNGSGETIYGLLHKNSTLFAEMRLYF